MHTLSDFLVPFIFFLFIPNFQPASFISFSLSDSLSLSTFSSSRNIPLVPQKLDALYVRRDTFSVI